VRQIGGDDCISPELAHRFLEFIERRFDDVLDQDFKLLPVGLSLRIEDASQDGFHLFELLDLFGVRNQPGT